VQSHARSTTGALRFPVRVNGRLAATLASLGVCRLYPRTLEAYPPIREAMAVGPGDFPGATLLAAELHTLPTHPLLSQSEARRIVEVLAPSNSGPA
jgi:dTDP-4-amino-4,6-dideoxygalactose transaminase